MKKILHYIIVCCLFVFMGKNSFAGCAPGEAYIEIIMNSDNFVSIETTVIITIGGVIVFDSGLVGGLPADGTTGVILDGCFPEGDIIDITYADTFGDGILIDPPFFIQNGCTFVASGLADGVTGSVYNAPVETDADATPQAGNPNGTAAAGCPGGPATSTNLGSIAVSPTLPNNVTPPSFPAGFTPYPVCDVAGGDDTGNTLSGTSPQDFSENFVVCADFTQPNVTGNETGAYIGAGANTLEYTIGGFNDIDVGTPSDNDCGSGFAAIDVFESGTCALVSSGTTTLTGLTPGTTYTVCVEFFASDFGEGADGVFGTADDEPTADGSCTLQGIFIGVEPFDMIVVCETYNAISLAAGCNVFDICIGYADVDQDGLSDVGGADPIGTMMTVDFGAATGGTLINDGIFPFDEDGDGVVDATGYCVTYVFDVQGCDPIPYSGLVTLMCPDGTEGTLDVGTGPIALTDADILGDLFGLPGGGAFYPSLTATTTAAVCPTVLPGPGVGAFVEITSPDGTVCSRIDGTPPDCDAAGGNAAEVVQANPIADPLLSAIFGAGSFACTIDETADLSFDCAVCDAAACTVTLTAPASATGCDINDGAGFAAPLDLAACTGADGPVGTGQVYDIYLYAPGGAPGVAAPAGYEATPIPPAAEYPDPFQDGNLIDFGVTDQTCADVIGAVGLLNPTCDPATFTFLYFPFDYTLDSDDNDIAEYPQDCIPVRVDYTVNPTLTAVIQSDDAANCGDVVAILQDANDADCVGTEMTISCTGNGSATDFTLADNGCGPYTVSGTACAGCPVAACEITVTISNFACDTGADPDDPADDTVTFDYTVTATDGTTWSSDQGDAGVAYGTIINVGPLPADGTTFTINVNDDDAVNNAACIDSASQTLTSCSGATTDIPTLSQWGLITLMLALMSFGAIKMSSITTLTAIRRKDEE